MARVPLLLLLAFVAVRGQELTTLEAVEELQTTTADTALREEPVTQRVAVTERASTTTQRVAVTERASTTTQRVAVTERASTTTTTSKPSTTQSVKVETITASTPRTLITQEYKEYNRISTTIRPEGISETRTERPLITVQEPIRREDTHTLRVSSTVRPVVAGPIRFATKPPRVVHATRHPVFLQTSTSKAELLPQPAEPVPAFFIPQKQQQASGTQIRRKGGIKIKKRKKKDHGMSSLLYIPIMIQAQLIPMMLMKLKFLALKALTIGKLALLILGLNLLRNAMLGHDNDAEQYEHENLANQHYGYNGGPEYGSWINRRLHNPQSYIIRRNKFGQNIKNDFQDRSDVNVKERENSSNPTYFVVTNNDNPATTVLNKYENNPYRAYRNNLIKEKEVPVKKVD